MPIEIICANKVRYYKVTESLDVETVIRSQDDYHRDLPYRAAISYAEFDKNVEWKFGLREVREISRYFDKIGQRYETVQSIFVVNSEVSYGMVHMLFSLLTLINKKYGVHVFRDRAAAVKKLREIYQELDEQGLLEEVPEFKQTGTGGD